MKHQKNEEKIKKQENGRFEYICNYFHTNVKQCRKTIISSLLKMSR